MFSALLRWKEPKEFLKASRKDDDIGDSYYLRLLVGLHFFQVLMLAWSLGQIRPNGSHISIAIALVVSAAITWIAIWVLPELARHIPGEVQMQKKGIVLKRFGSGRAISYRKLRTYYWTNDGRYRVLALIPKKGHTTVIAIPDLATQKRVTEVLAVAGLSPTNDPERDIDPTPTLNQKRAFFLLSI